MLLTIGIPTYNRVGYLERLLKNIIPQAKKMPGIIQICVFDNDSADGTEKLVAGFVNAHPGLICYQKNSKNLGHDRNVLKVMEMSEGEFLWLLGDDDLTAEGSIAKIIDFLKKLDKDKAGFIMLAHQSYIIDEKTNREVVYVDTVETTKPLSYAVDVKEILGIKLNNSFISTMVFNGRMLKKVLQEEKTLIEKATGCYYIHTFIYQLMLLKYPSLQLLRYNEAIVKEDLHVYKIYIEDRFKVYYKGRKKLNNLLFSSGYANDEHKKILTVQQLKVTKSVVKEMFLMKAFKALQYISFSGCIKLFFAEAPLIDAILFSLFFILFLIIPSLVLRGLYKLFVVTRYGKKWRQVWLTLVVSNSHMSQGTKRIMAISGD